MIWIYKILFMVSKAIPIAILLSLFGLNLAIAQEDDEAPSANISNSYDFQELGGMASRLAPHGNDLMGDMIDKNTGGITFEHTDVSIPGNSNLEVALRRKLVQGSKSYTPYQQGFSEWVIDLPIAYTAYGFQSTAQEPQFNNGCLEEYGSMRIDGSLGGRGGTLDLDWRIFTSGVTLHVPGQGVSGYQADPMQPQDPKSNWITAPDTRDHANRCATQVIAPDGTKYKFGRHTFRKAESFRAPYTSFLNSPARGHVFSTFLGDLTRKYAVFLITEVEDVNGNWVRYEYTNDDRAELTRIHSNDLREITLSYETAVPSTRNSRRVSSVTANGRTWEYDYANDFFLHIVTLPDGRYWRLGDSNDGIGEMSFEVQQGHECVPQDVNFSIKHPDGAIGTFNLIETRHIKGASNLGSQDDDSDHYMRAMDIPLVTNNDDCDGTDANPDFVRPIGWPVYRVMSLASKTISGAGLLEDIVWSYRYRNYTGGDLSQNWTDITGPDDTRRRYTHQAIGEDHGLLKRVDVVPESGTGESIVYDYNLDLPVNPGCLVAGLYGDSSGVCHAFKQRPVSKVVQTREGTTYTTQNFYDRNGDRFTDFGYPNRELRSSSVPGSTVARDTTTTYEHKTGINVIGLTKLVRQNGRELVNHFYDSRGRLESQTRFGQPYVSYTYHTNSLYQGALASTFDAEDREIYRSDYKRGTPQSTRRPDNTELSVTIDDNGWLMSSTDAMSNTTTYERDNMGRLELIDPPGDWDNTSIDYDFSNGGAVQTINRGQSKETITYDEMYRPILERSQALDTGWSSYTNTRYHPAGQVSFTSQPSTNSNETKGVNYSYDGLGRLTQTQENVAPFATEGHRYLSNNRYEVTDALGHKTTSYRDGYSGAGAGDLIQISQPLGTNTFLHRNIWGQLTQVQQTGNLNGFSVNQSQHYYYDSRQRVCRSRTPEGGDTLNAYDDSGYLTSYAKGMSFGATCVAPSGPSKVTLELDDLARVEKVDFADANTPDIITTFDDNGNVRTNNRDGVNWTYTYDELNHLTRENLSVNGRNYNIGYDYDTAENLIERTLPSGRVVTYDHDGLGRERYALSNGVFYANNIDYYPSSHVSTMTYGNGQVFEQKLNNRLLPERLVARKGGTTALDLTYTYDARGSIKTMLDGVDNFTLQSFDYDALGNLTVANGPWGAGNFTYDALGNIRYKTIDVRQVSLSYNGANQVSQSMDTAGSTRTIGYDPRGNVTTLGTQSFTYDYSDQPTGISGSNSGTYQYDGNMKRVKAKVDGKTIYNVYDASGSLVHVDKMNMVVVPYGDLIVPVAASNATEYIQAAGMTVARINNDKPTYLHSNHLGSPLAGTTDTGAIAWQEQYMPYGEKRIGNAANDDQGSFTGHIDDSATGLTYMQARYYDPVMGRFLSIDPVGFSESNPISFNRYAYANNSPYTFVDPDGELPILPLIPPALEILSAALAGFSIGSGVSDVARGEKTVGEAVGDTAVGLAVSVVPAGLGRAAGPLLSGARGGEDFVTVFRGVRPSHPGFKNAQNGVAKPRSPLLGHSDPARHNAGDTKSKFVSVTTNRSVAKRFSEKDGVIIESQVQRSRLISSPDKFEEAESLIRGTLKGNVTDP